MKSRILFLLFSILFIGCLASHNMTNHELLCDSKRWNAFSGSSIENGVLTAGEETEGRVLETLYYSLDQGEYKVTLKYHASAPGTELTVENFDGPLVKAELPSGDGVSSVEIPVSLNRDCVNFRLCFDKKPGGSLTVWEIHIIGAKPVNNDATYLAILAAVGLAGLYVLLFLSRNRIPPDTVFAVLLLVCVCVLISGPLFREGLYRGDDLDYHVYRIEGMRDAVKNGQFPVYFFPYAFNGYGYLNVLYPSLFLYPAVFSRILGVSSMTCYKSLLFAINLGTAWIAYGASKRLFGNRHKWEPLLFAILYLMAPYRITNLFVRAAVGELLAMMFLPLIALGLYELLSGDRKKWWYLAVGYSGLIQSHILSCLTILIFSLLAGIFYADVFFRERRWIELLKVIFCLLVFNAWYLIPFFVYMRLDLNLENLRTDWYLHVADLAEVFQSYISRFPGNYTWRSNSLGLAGQICLALGMAGVLGKRKKDKKQEFLSVLLVCGLIFTIVITSLVPWKLLRQSAVIDEVAKMMQFPWRFLAFSSLCLLLAGVGWLYENEALSGYRPVIGSVLILAAALSAGNIMNQTAYKGLLVPPDRPLVLQVSEYMMEGSDYKDCKRGIYLSDQEKVEVREYTLETSGATVCLTCEEEGQYIEAPVFHFPGYRAFDKNGCRLPVKTGSNNRVRVLLSPSEQEQVITVKFVGERVFYIGYGITLGAAVWLLWYRNRERLSGWLKRMGRCEG